MRRLLVLVAAAALSLTSLACGGDDPAAEEATAAAATTAAAPSLEGLAEKTAEAGTARITNAVTTTMELFPEPLTMAGEGVVDFASESSEITMDLSQLAAATGGVVSGELEAKVVALVMYVRFPPEFAELPEGKSWVRFDLEESDEALGSDFQALSQAGTDPTQWLEVVESAADSFTVVGEEDVRGEPTTRFRGTIDLVTLAAEGPEDLRELFESLAESTGADELEMEIWVDAEGRARQYELEQPLPAVEGVEGTQTIRQEFYDFGVEASIEAPPAGQVIDFSELQ